LHYLHILKGVDKGCSCYLRSDHVYIGRSYDNDIPLNDIFVSRRHLKVQRRGENHFIQDLLSRNGTVLNGRKLRPGLECKIKNQDTIGIGGTVIRLERRDPADLEAGHDHKELVGKGNVTVRKSQEPNLNQRLLQEFSDLLKQSHTFGELLAKMLDCLFTHFDQIDRCAFIVVDAETKKTFEVASEARRGCDDNVLRYSRAVVNRVLRSGKAVMVSNLFDQDGVELSWSMELMKIDAAMCVPLMGPDGAKGVIYLDCLRRSHPFCGEDLSTLSALSILLSLALTKGYPHPHNPFIPWGCASAGHEACGVGARVRSMFETMGHGVISLSKRYLYH